MFSIHNKLFPEKFQKMFHKNSAEHFSKPRRRIILESRTLEQILRNSQLFIKAQNSEIRCH